MSPPGSQGHPPSDPSYRPIQPQTHAAYSRTAILPRHIDPNALATSGYPYAASQPLPPGVQGQQYPYDPSMLDRVSVVCPNIGIVYSGMSPDFRILVARARKSAQAYWKVSSLLFNCDCQPLVLRSMASILQHVF